MHIYIHYLFQLFFDVFLISFHSKAFHIDLTNLGTQLSASIHMSSALNWKKLAKENKRKILSQNSIKKLGLDISSQFIFESDNKTMERKLYDPRIQIFMPRGERRFCKIKIAH